MFVLLFPRLALQGIVCYTFSVLSGGNKPPLCKGRWLAKQDGGIVKVTFYRKTIPQPAFLLRYAPWQVCYANIAAVSSLYTREPLLCAPRKSIFFS